MLAVIGGTDRGLRMGGRCYSKLNMKRGTVLGVLKEGSSSVKVLWDDSDAIVRLVGWFVLLISAVKHTIVMKNADICERSYCFDFRGLE